MFNFIRVIRTRTSEVWGILSNEDVMIGRIDLHYADDGRIDGSVIIQEKLNKEEEQKLCEQIDIELIDSADLSSDSFSITVSQINSINLYGKDDN
tara:strand:+ start:2470 stop:2754 length:285 start_codon:yes stop_codon:yes gene_type:complete